MTTHRSACRPALGAVVALLVAACGGGGGAVTSPPPTGGGNTGVCGVDAQKQFVLNTTRDWYLFAETLPAQVDLAQFSTAEALLDALTATARSQNRDRFFSSVVSIAEEEQFFTAGQSVGFGIGTSVRENNTRLFITQAFETSAAAQAGFARGDEVLAIGMTLATLEPIATILSRTNGFSDAIGPAEAGVTRSFRVRTNAGAVVERTVTKRAYDLNPVPTATLIARQGLASIGYINFRTFVSTADAQLTTAFRNFAANNVRDVIVDLRYNGGGLVSTAELLTDLLARGRATQEQYRTQYNAARGGANNRSVAFRDRADAIPALKIAFLTTGSSASASELTINSLAPYADVAVIGARTFGKPVAQSAFNLASGCDTRLRLVTFKTVNRDGNTDYFDGLPNATFTDGPLCAASDDVTQPQGNAAERMTAAAISWINTNTCPVQPAAVAATKAARDEIGKAELPQRPSVAQIYQPGTY
jgi:C-terminal processing protease CtpA/Prc